MKLEMKLLTFNMVSNFFTALVKIVGGLIFGMGALIADGVHTFADFIMDIVTMIGAKLSKKRPTKRYPFGFGRVEYLTNLFIGIFLFLVGIFLFIISFFLEFKIPSLNILYVLMIAITIKSITILYLSRESKKIKSQILVVGTDESKMDLISSIAIAFIVIILQFSIKIPALKYIDIIGSLILSSTIVYGGFNIIKENALNLLGAIETDDEITNYIKDLVEKFDDVNVVKIELIKYGAYYKVHLLLTLNPNLNLKKIDILEKQIEHKLKRNKKVIIKYVNIDVDPQFKIRK